MNIRLLNLEWAEKSKYIGTDPTLSSPPWKEFELFFETFCNEPGKKHVMAPGYAIPASSASATIDWTWLRWHLDQNASAIRANLAITVERGLLLHQTSVWEHRDDFDLCMIMAAILSGDNDLMKRAAESVWHAGEHLKQHDIYPFYSSLTGIMKYSVLGNLKEREHQYEIYKETGTLPYIALPGRALLGAFMRRDYKKFAKQLKTDCEKYNERVLKEGIKIRKPARLVAPDVIELDLSKRMGRYYWPSMEAVLAKLALRDGAEIIYDSTWLPRGLLLM